MPFDPLKFRDEKRYADRLQGRARQDRRSGCAEGRASATIDGITTTVAVQIFDFMGGSLGMAVGEGLVAAMRHAAEERTPFVLFSASGGARMQEGILSLMQMPRTTVAIQMLNEAGLPYIVVHTDPTTGGVTASYAMLGDIQIAEPGALIGFAGPRVIENTIREKLPEGFQRAEYLLDHGMVDMVVHRHKLRETLARVLKLLTRKRRARELPAVARGQRLRRADAASGAIASRPTTTASSRRKRWHECRPARGALASDQILARLTALHPKSIDLSLGRIERLLAKLGNPERKLPPVIHVAGTNGKGSTCAFLRAILEGSRQARARLHLAASRALSRAHPTHRQADRRGRTCRRCSTSASGERRRARSPSSRSRRRPRSSPSRGIPSDAVILEVGLGGRLDATNVIADARGVDHHADRSRSSELSRRRR